MKVKLLNQGFITIFSDEARSCNAALHILKGFQFIRSQSSLTVFSSPDGRGAYRMSAIANNPALQRVLYG